MKLNKDTLKSLIVEVLKQDEIILEAPKQSKYDRIMSRLRDADYGSIAMMSGQYPMGRSSDLSLLQDLKRQVTKQVNHQF